MSASKIEFCDFTGLPIIGCLHCNNHYHDVPHKYVLKPGSYMGQPVVEVLKNGGPIHPYDKNFRFGIKKARILLAALSIIQEFAEGTTHDGATTIPASQVILDANTNRYIRVLVEMHSWFIHSTRKTITCPWLSMESLPPSKITRIGVGVEKAKALSAVADELKAWLTQVAPYSSR